MDAWRTVRVFISSTFRDMQAERDYLVRFVFPELKARCARLRLHLVDVDLRWGVTEEESRQGKVLQVVLDEIDRCRPFFVAILGERYGWVPPAYQIDEGFGYGWLQKMETGHSITALEIYHGVLRNPAMQSHAFFYFRNPLFLAHLPDSLKDAFVSESAESATKLKKLKEEIRQQFPVFEYSCEVSADSAEETQIVQGLESFGNKILGDLWNVISAEYPEARITSEFTDKSYDENFIERSSRHFVNRQSFLDLLIEQAGKSNEYPLIITGQPGSGKSALLAKFAREYSASFPDQLLLTHFIGVGPASTDMRQMLRKLCRTIAVHFSIDRQLPEDLQELKSCFAEFLIETGRRGKTVMIVDAVNQLDEASALESVHWLPKRIPENVSVFLTCAEGNHLAMLKSRIPKHRFVQLGPLSEEDRAQIVRRILWEHRKRLDESSENNQMHLLLSKSENPLFLIVACEELRVFGFFDRISERIRLLPDNMEELFVQVINRLEGDHGKELVRDVLSVLSASKDGLLESEMLELLRRPPADRLPQAIWSRLYLSLQSYLRPPGESGEGALDFFHTQLEQASRQRYFRGDAEVRIHSKLADYFRKKIRPSDSGGWVTGYPRGLRLLPFHLLHAQRLEELYDLARDDSFLKIQGLAFPDDPRLAFETIQLAMRGAAEAENAARSVEFLIAHAVKTERTKMESPLDACRRGNLERAWQLANFYDPEERTLWLLLLSWELLANGELQKTKATLERLLSAQAPRLAQTGASLAIAILVEIAEQDDETLLELEKRLFENVDRIKLAVALAERRLFSLARTIGLEMNVFRPGSDISKAIAYSQKEAALETMKKGEFQTAINLVSAIEDTAVRTVAYQEISYVAQPDAELAREVLEIGLQSCGPRPEFALAYLRLSDTGIAGEIVNKALSWLSAFDPDSLSRREDYATLEATALAVTALGLVQRSIEAIQKNKSPYDRIRALFAIASALAKAGHVEAAYETAELVYDLADRSEILGQIGSYFAAAGMEIESNAAFHQAFETANQVTDIRRSRVLQMLAFESLRSRRYSIGKRCIDEALKNQPNDKDNFSGLMKACLQIPDSAEKEHYSDRILKEARNIKNDYYRGQVLRSLAKMLAQDGQIDLALQLYAEAPDYLPWAESEIMAEVALVHARRHQFDSAVRIAKEWGLRHIILAITHLEGRSNASSDVRFRYAEAIPKKDLLQKRIREEPLPEICYIAAQAGYADRALKLAEKIQEESHRNFAFARIVQAEADSGRIENAEKLIQTINDDHHRSGSLEAIAVARARQGDFDATLAIFATLHKNRRFYPAAMCKAADTFALSGFLEMAERLLEWAVEAAQTDSPARSQADRLAEVASQLARCGFHDASHRVFAIAIEKAETEGKQPPPQYMPKMPAQYRQSALKQIGHMQVSVNQLEEALDTAERMMDPDSNYKKPGGWDRAKLEVDIAVRYAAKDDIPKAIAVTEKISEKGREFRLDGLCRIALTQHQKGAFQSALELLDRAYTLALIPARREKDLEARIKELTGIAASYNLIGEKDRGQAVFDEAIRLCNSQSWQKDRERCLSEVAVGLATGGEAERALRLTQSLNLSQSEIDALLKKIALIQIAKGSTSDAVKTADEIGGPGRAKHLLEIASALVELGDRASYRGFLPKFAYDLDAAFQAALHLAKLYPEESPAIAETIA